jgi:hypothetical protein
LGIAVLEVICAAFLIAPGFVMALLAYRTIQLCRWLWHKCRPQPADGELARPNSRSLVGREAVG